MGTLTHSFECYKWHHDCAKTELERLRAEVGGLEAQLNTVCNTIGGTVEGEPTSRLNYLQRLRELINERDHWERIAIHNKQCCEKTMNERNALRDEVERWRDLAKEMYDNCEQCRGERGTRRCVRCQTIELALAGDEKGGG